ncbi:MAG: hypothetical protein NXI10_00525 [bacterium]|nr:hypothetical protein [bacterium]
MKNALLTILLCNVGLSFAQSPNPDCSDYFEPIAAGRSTDARSEAMGLTNVTSWDNINTSFYNPATLSTIEGIQASGTYANAFYNFDEAFYTYLGIGGKINRYLNFKLSRFSFDSNEPIDVFGNVYDRKYTFTTFGYGAELIKNWHLGVNLKHLESQSIQGETFTGFMSDIGVVGKIQLDSNRHVLKPGLSFSNFTASKPENAANEDKYPIYGRAGISYEFTSINHLIRDTIPLFCAIVQADYEDDFTRPYRRSFKAGVELSLVKMLHLRAGYYYQSTNDVFCSPAGDFLLNDPFINSFTYGIGIEAPIHLWIQLPIRLKVDYARMMEAELYDEDNFPSTGYDAEMFQSLTMRLDWKF